MKLFNKDQRMVLPIKLKDTLAYLPPRIPTIVEGVKSISDIKNYAQIKNKLVIMDSTEPIIAKAKKVQEPEVSSAIEEEEVKEESKPNKRKKRS